MNLSAPTMIVFVISVVLAIASLAVHYGGMSLGLGSYHWALLAYIVLMLGNLLKGM
ncbi:MAG: hypothetical protein WBO55_02935 [Rhizobiaceae bacterium]